MSALLTLRSVVKRWSCCIGTWICLRMQDWVHTATSACHAHLVVQITELLHQVFGDPCPGVGLVVSHAILSEQADAPHAPLPISGVLEQPVFLCQVVDRVPIGSMDPGGSKLQSCFSWRRKKKNTTQVGVWVELCIFFFLLFLHLQKNITRLFLIENCVLMPREDCITWLSHTHVTSVRSCCHRQSSLRFITDLMSADSNQQIYSRMSCKCGLVRVNTKWNSCLGTVFFRRSLFNRWWKHKSLLFCRQSEAVHFIFLHGTNLKVKSFYFDTLFF